MTTQQETPPRAMIPVSPEVHRMLKIRAIQEDRTLQDLVDSILSTETHVTGTQTQGQSRGRSRSRKTA